MFRVWGSFPLFFSWLQAFWLLLVVDWIVGGGCGSVVDVVVVVVVVLLVVFVVVVVIVVIVAVAVMTSHDQLRNDIA